MPPKIISKEFLHELGAQGLIQFIIEAAKKTVQDVTTHVTKKAVGHQMRRIKHVAEWRGECMAFIATLGEDGKKLLAHLDRHLPYDNGVVHQVVMLYQHLSSKGEKDLRTKIFTAMARMTNEEFDNFVEHLTNDVIEQYARRGFDALMIGAHQLDAAAAGAAVKLAERRKNRLKNSRFVQVSKKGGLLGFILDPYKRFRS